MGINSSWKHWNPRFSQLYIIFASIVAFIAFLYFNSQLIIETRTLKAHYTDPEVTYLVSVMVGPFLVLL